MTQNWSVKSNSTVASAAERSGTGVLMFLIYCLLLLPIFVESLSCMQYSISFWFCCHLVGEDDVTIQNGWNNRISYGCVYAQIRSGLGMHLGTYSNHDTVLFLLIVPIKGRFV